MDNEKPEFKVLNFEKLNKGEVPQIGQLAPSKYNIEVNGRTMKLRIEPCSCGLRAVYFQEISLAEMMADAPEFLKEAVKNQKKIIEVTDEHFEITFWDKLFGRTYAHKIKEFHERISGIVAEIDAKEDITKKVIKDL